MTAKQQTAVTKPLDLASLDTIAACNEGAEIELRHPVTRLPLGQFITVVGKDSDVMQTYIRENTNDRLRANAVARRRGKQEDTKTAEELENEALELLSICTIGFRDVNFNGPYSFSQANAYKLYQAFPWIKSQIDAAIADIENFMKA